MSIGVYLPKAYSEIFLVISFHDIWLVLNVKRLCVMGIVLSAPRKCMFV